MNKNHILEFGQNHVDDDLYEFRLNMFKKAKSFILYHGTSSLFLEKIIEKGILPRKFTGNSTYEDREKLGLHNLDSNPELVYFGKDGWSRTLGSRAVQKFGGELIVLRVHLDKKKLFPDEDSGKNCPLESLAWEWSLAHKGVVNSNKILGYFTKDNTYYTLKQNPSNSILYNEKELTKHIPIIL